MLPLVCNDAVAILFMFDLSRKSTLNSVKEWYRQARGFNKVSMQTSYLIGDDTFASLGLVLMGRDVAWVYFYYRLSSSSSFFRDSKALTNLLSAN